MGSKQWEKEKMLVTSIFSFPTLFSKALLFRAIKSRDSEELNSFKSLLWNSRKKVHGKANKSFRFA